MSDSQTTNRNSKVISLISHFEALAKQQQNESDATNNNFQTKRINTLVQRPSKRVRRKRSNSWDSSFRIKRELRREVIFKLNPTVPENYESEIEKFEKDVYFKEVLHEEVNTVSLSKPETHNVLLYKDEIEKYRSEAKKLLKLYTQNFEDNVCSLQEVKNIVEDNGVEETYYPQHHNCNIVGVEYNNDEFHKECPRVSLDGEFVVLRNKANSHRTTENKYECVVIYDSNNIRRTNAHSLKRDEKICLFEELISSEEKYIEDLKYTIINYMEYFSKHLGKALSDYVPFVFNNIVNIYKESQEFLRDLKHCKATDEQYNNIGKVFRVHKNLLLRYIVYIRGHTKAVVIIKEGLKYEVNKRERFLNDPLGLNSHLHRPIQRLTKYEQILKKMIKLLSIERNNTSELEVALKLVKSVTCRGNALLILDGIKENPYCITDTGEYILNDNFKIISPKKKLPPSVYLFLFNKKLIFAVKDQKHVDRYLYKKDIDVVNLGMPSIISENSFSVSYYKKNKKKMVYILEVKDYSLRDKWFTAIQDLLWQQFLKVKEEKEKQQGLVKNINSFKPGQIKRRRLFSS